MKDVPYHSQRQRDRDNRFKYIMVDDHGQFSAFVALLILRSTLFARFSALSRSSYTIQQRYTFWGEGLSRRKAVESSSGLFWGGGE